MTFDHTRRACYAGYVTQAIVNNLAPLLFIVFQTRYELPYELRIGGSLLFAHAASLILPHFRPHFCSTRFIWSCMNTSVKRCLS